MEPEQPVVINQIEPVEPPDAPPCPPGLEYLQKLDQLLIQQSTIIIEAFTGFESRNKFSVKNTIGHLIYYAAEESECWQRMFCGSHRGFVMHVADKFGNESMRMIRKFKPCAIGWQCSACCERCSWEIKVQAPVGVIIGYVKQECSPLRDVLSIQNENRENVLKLVGPVCMCELPCCDVHFTVYSMDGTECGIISKSWDGLAKEVFTQADNFGVKFPMDLDVKVKATLLGAVFLIVRAVLQFLHLRLLK